MSGIRVTGLKETLERFKKAEKAVNTQLMLGVATYGENLIKQRTDKGEFLNGSGKQYSKAGAIFPIAGSAKLKQHYRSKLIGANSKFQLFGRSGEEWKRRGIRKDDSIARYVFLENGYFQFRQLTNKQVAFVNLNYTGKMLNGMRSISEGDNKAVISFERAEDRIKAYYLSFAGAGKNKIVYDFFGFNEKEKDQMMDLFETEVTEWLRGNDVL
ncbi:MAG: hypothetical protein JJ958_06715 [Balneola sp.]|nr:hypothetical protein [Balneola sp.]